MSETVRVVLTSPISYANASGNVVSGSFVTLSAPSSSAFKVALRIKQELMRAIVGAARDAAARGVEAEEEAGEPERPSGPDYLKMLASSTADLGALATWVRELIVDHGIAKVDGEVRMTALLVDSLSLADFEAIVGEYLTTFPLA